MCQSIRELNLDVLVAAVTQNANDALRAGAVKARSAAERGGGAEQRGLDGAEPSATLDRVMAANQCAPGFSVLTLLEQGGSRARSAASLRDRSGLGSGAPTARLRER
jgi:hypothetical protein